jgi:hypothetical protein
MLLAGFAPAGFGLTNKFRMTLAADIGRDARQFNFAFISARGANERGQCAGAKI